MAVIAVALYLLGMVAATAVLWLTLRHRGGAVPSAKLASVIGSARRRALSALSAAGLVFVAGAFVGFAVPALGGIPFACTPMLAAAAGLLLYGAIPPRSVVLGDGESRTARLVPRSLLSAVPRRWGGVFGAAVALFIVVVWFCGATASTDEYGRARVIRFEAEGQMQSASPYPGWYYGVPALLALLILVLCTVIALARVSSTPAFPDAADVDVDDAWRRGSAEVIIKLSAGAVLFSLGGAAAIAGYGMKSATIDGVTATIWDTMGDVLAVSGVVFLTLSIVSVTLAAFTAAAIGRVATKTGPKVTA